MEKPPMDDFYNLSILPFGYMDVNKTAILRLKVGKKARTLLEGWFIQYWRTVF